MSLLRDALKKAERAQEEARQQAGEQPLTLESPPALEAFAVVEPTPQPEVPPLDPGPVASEEPPQISAPRAHARSQPTWEPSPRLPFYFALSALLLVAAGASGYFWMQLRTPSPVAPAVRPVPPAAQAQAKPAVTAPLLATTEQALASLARPEASESVPAGSPVALPAPKPRPAAPPSARTEPILLPRPPAGPPARLAINDPLRLKELPAPSDPGAALLASLANEHARNGRWSEARDAFAVAAADDPDDPDFAFNLAVSYDRLQRKREALEHYQRALGLRQGRPARFPADAARERVRYLARASAGESR